MTLKKRPLTKLPKIVTAGARYAKRLAEHIKRKTRGKRVAPLAVILLLVLSTTALGQSLNDVAMWSLVNGRYTGKYKPLLTTYVTEGTNQWFTNARARAAFSAVGPLSYNSGTGAFSLNAITGSSIANGYVVREINGFKDEVIIAAENGGSVRIATGPTADSIIVNPGIGGGGGSITAVQNGDGRLQVTNPNGPTVTLNIIAEKIDSAVIKDGTVRSEEIKDGTIQRVDLTAGLKAYDADAADLADSAIAAGHAKLADSSLTVKDNSITSAKISNGSILPADADTSSSGLATAWDALHYSGVGTFPSNDTITVTLPGITSSWGGSASWYGKPTGLVVYGVKCFSGYCQIYGSASPLEGLQVWYRLEPPNP